MRLQLWLPKVDPKELSEPGEGRYAGGGSKEVQRHQPVEKALRDTMHQQVQVPGYRGLKWGRTFRVYPKGVSKAQTSARVKGLAVMWDLVGLSSGALSLAMESLGGARSKTEVYHTGQAAARRMPAMKQEQVFGGMKTHAVGGELTRGKCAGKWRHLGISRDALSGLALTMDALGAEEAKALKEWREPIAKSVGAHVLVTADADALKTVADELGREHQVCKRHGQRNTQDLIDALCPKAATDADGSLSAGGVKPGQAEADLKRLGELIVSRKPEEVTHRREMHPRDLKAAPPGKGERPSLASGFRRLFLDRYQLWSRLTGYRKWHENHDDLEHLDGTKKACERGMGWWIHERYRRMRGYKVPPNAVCVSRLLAWCGNFLHRGGAHLASWIG